MAGFRSSEHPGDEKRQQYRRVADETVEHVQKQAHDAIDALNERIQQILREQKQSLSDQVSDIGRALDAARDQLQSQQHEQAAYYLHYARDWVEQTSGYLQRHEVSQLYERVREQARQHPVVFFGSAAIGGLIIARLIRAAAEPELRSEDPDNPSSSSGGQHLRAGSDQPEAEIASAGQSEPAPGPDAPAAGSHDEPLPEIPDPRPEPNQER